MVDEGESGNPRVSQTLVIAHRTCALDAPENSIAGIAAAPGLGADAVEIDVRLTRDGVPVLLHDRTMWRTAGIPRAVRKTDSSQWGRARHRGTSDPLPTLEDALAALPAGLQIAIDVKDDRATQQVVDLVREHDLSERSMVWVRHPSLVSVVADLMPNHRIALLHNSFTEDSSLAYLRKAKSSGAGQVSIHQRGITARVVEEADDMGLTALCWVVREPEHRRVLDTGVAGVVTDWPTVARSLIAR